MNSVVALLREVIRNPLVDVQTKTRAGFWLWRDKERSPSGVFETPC